MIQKLRRYWTVWRRYGVTPWRYERDLKAMREYVRLMIGNSRWDNLL